MPDYLTPYFIKIIQKNDNTYNHASTSWRIRALLPKVY